MLGVACFKMVSRAPNPNEQDHSSPQILGFSSTYAYTLWRRETKCDAIKYVGEGHTLSQGRWAQRSPILGVPPYADFFDIQISMVTHMRRGMVSGISHVPSQGTEPKRSSIFWYAVLIPTRFEPERPKSGTVVKMCGRRVL